MMEIIEEWNYYDGFRDGVVRIDGTLYHAWAVDYITDTDEDDTRIRARALFYELHEALGTDLTGAAPEPPELNLTYAELYERNAPSPEGGDSNGD